MGAVAEDESDAALALGSGGLDEVLGEVQGDDVCAAGGEKAAVASPQPRSRPTSPETAGSIAKNAGVLTRSR